MRTSHRSVFSLATAARLAAVVLVALASLVTRAPSPARAQAAFTATATLGIFADFAHQVGGERVEVLQLLGDGVDPHGYQMTPNDLVGVNRSQMLVYNGRGLEPFLNQVLQAAPTGLVRVELTEGLPPLQLGNAPDPHMWLDPQLAQRYVEKIRDAFSAQDPAGADTYRANAARYVAELQALDADLENQFGQLPAASRKLVTTHDALHYFARRYGFEVIGAVLSGEGREPSPTEIIALVRQIRQSGVRAFFVEPQFNARTLDQLAGETGLRVVPLYTDAFPADGSVRTYLDMMRFDARTIVDALR